MRIEYQCTTEDFQEARRVVVRKVGRGPGWWKAWLPVAIVLLLVVFQLSDVPGRVRYMSARDLMHQIARSLPTFPGFALLVMGLLFVWQRFFKNDKQSDHPLMTLEVENDGLRFESRTGSEQLTWDGLDRFLETPNLFVLLRKQFGPTVYYPVPKRAMGGDEQQAQFRQVLDGRLRAPVSAPPAETNGPPGVVVRFHCRYIDYLDGAVASWRTRAVMVLPGLAIAAGILIAYGSGAFGGRPVVIGVRELLWVTLPWALGPVVAFPLLFAAYAWFMNSDHQGEEQLTLSPAGVSARLAGGRVDMQWEELNRFKETRRSYLLWKSSPLRPSYILLPKRAISSDQDRRRIADLLASHCTRSAWFFR